MSIKIDARYGHKGFKISITRYGHKGFKIDIGTNKIFIANDLDEVHRAIDHYFGINEEYHTNLNAKCPLCRTNK